MALAHASEASAADRPEAAKYRVYIGTYTTGASRGIYLFELDAVSGELTSRGLAGESVNPSFLAVHPSRRFLYAVGEVGEFNGEKTGAVSAFTIDAASGSLSLLNQQSSRGQGPCYVTVDRAGKNALVANYDSGSVACLPIGGDGRLAPASSFIQHQGSSVNSAAAEGAARAFHQPRRGESVRDCGRPWPRQAPGLSVRCGKGHVEPERARRSPRWRRGRAEAFRVPPRRAACVCDQRDALHGHRLRLRPRTGGAQRDPDCLDAPQHSRGEGLLNGRGAGASLGPVPLRLEPGTRYDRDLRDRLR